MAKHLVSGEDILYRALQEILSHNDQSAISKILKYAVFLEPRAAELFPVLRPGVVRDVRKKLHDDKYGRGDDWGRADSRGLVRDDNSLLKSITKSLRIVSPVPFLDGKRLGNGWVASHIWRRTRTLEAANKHPWLNSFVPNLVWLPKQVAKLSDREGGHIQNALKLSSIALYRGIKYEDPEKQAVVDACWDELQEPAGVSLEISNETQFELHQSWITRTETRLSKLHDGARSGDPKTLKMAGLPSNYLESEGFGSPQFLDGLRSATAFLGYGA